MMFTHMPTMLPVDATHQYTKQMQQSQTIKIKYDLAIVINKITSPPFIILLLIKNRNYDK